MAITPSSGSAEKRKRVSANQTEEKQRIVKDSKKKDKKRKVQLDTENAREEEEEKEDMAQGTKGGFEQGYCVVPSEKRFILLYSFLKQNQSKKVMVFFSTNKAVVFYSELLRYNQVPCLDMHGDQNQTQRSTTFLNFCKAEKGILLCGDVVAWGLDIPALDWIVQYDPPVDPLEYIHRVGQTARGEGAKGKALLFLLPQELQFLRYLKKAKVSVTEYEVPQKLKNVKSQLEKSVAKNYHLNRSAKEAYRTYIIGYDSHTMKDAFNVHRLDLLAVAASFCFTSPPKINFKTEISDLKHRKKPRMVN